MVPVRNPRRAVCRTPQQILTDLRDLVRNWGDSRPDGVCDALLLELLSVRPELKETQ